MTDEFEMNEMMQAMANIAATLGSFMTQLLENGFSREEALTLVIQSQGIMLQNVNRSDQ